jgi:ATP-dependent Lon protease
MSNKYNFRNKKVKPESSDSDSSSSDSDYETVDTSESENDSDYETESETESENKGTNSEEEVEAEDLYELLSEMFPSKYINEKKKASRKLMALDNIKKVKEAERKKSSKSSKLPVRKSKKPVVYDEDADDENDADADAHADLDAHADGEDTESEIVSKKEKKDKEREKKEKKKSKKESDKKTKSSSSSKKHKKIKEDTESSSSDSSSENELEDDDSETELDAANKINIFFTIDDSYTNDFYETKEDADAECDSEDEEVFMKETYEKIEDSTISNATSPTPEGEAQNNLFDKDVHSSDKKRRDKHKKDKKNRNRVLNSRGGADDDEIVLKDVAQEYLDLVELRKDLTHKLQKSPKNKILQTAVEDCKTSIQKLIKRSRSRNLKQYHKLIKNSSGQQKTNEFDYFKTKMSNKEQLKIMEDLKKINKHINVDKPYRLALLQSNIPTHFKDLAMQKMNLLRTMEPGDSEYYKIKGWVDNFMRIPFGIYRNLPVQFSDGMPLCQHFMENAKRTLDECVYGMEDAKMQIMQLIGQWIVNPASIGTAIAIKGAAGIGKTTLVRDGISKILGRDFSFIPLGGCSDGTYLTGNGYVYEGASHGKIVQLLIDSRSMNPVIFFDELDKVSDTPKGEEITGVLTHLTDTTQNSQFHDKYFSEIDFDMSKCLYIFSYNDETKINPILKDRMYRIEIKGYETKDKVIIARNYLLPKIREMVAFSETDVVIPDETIEYIANNKQFSQDEKGVRNLKRCLEIIFTKLNLYRLMKKEPDVAADTAPTTDQTTNTNTIINNTKLQVDFPFTVTKFAVDQLVKINDAPNVSLLSMYI